MTTSHADLPLPVRKLENIVGHYYDGLQPGFMLQAVGDSFRFVEVEDGEAVFLGELYPTLALAADAAVSDWEDSDPWLSLTDTSWGIALMGVAKRSHRVNIVGNYSKHGLGYLFQEVDGGYRFISIDAGEDDQVGETLPKLQDAAQAATRDWASVSDIPFVEMPWGAELHAMVKAA